MINSIKLMYWFII